MFESLFEALQMSFMQRALAATLAMSLLCPVMGLFLVLRRSSMTGDALSHSSTRSWGPSSSQPCAVS